MRVIEFVRGHARSIDLFESVSAASVHLGEGFGVAHVYCVYLGPGGEIGEHPTGFAQLFLVVEGRAWAVGEEGRRVYLSAGQGAYFDQGEMHSKGSEEGAAVIMVQADKLAVRAPEISL